VAWPTGVGQTGNAGVGQTVKSTEGSIGYVELAYVIQSQLQYAALKNSSGKYVKASLDGATAAAGTGSGISPTNFSITNASGDKASPIASYSWVFIRTVQTDATKGKAVVNLFKWVVQDAYKDSLVNGKALQYAPLPSESQTYSLSQLKQVTSGGKAILG